MRPNDQKTHPPIKSSNGNWIGVHGMFNTIQGEGIFVGMPATFLRLYGCNLQCPMCDTDYTSKNRPMTPGDIAWEILRMVSPAKLVVITGGEPFRQPIGKLLHALASAGLTVQIETNGTLPPPVEGLYGATVICSPKTGSVNKALQPHISAYKYVGQHDNLAEDDGLPTRALLHPASPRLARPHDGYNGPVYLQPADETMYIDDAGASVEYNKKNLEAVKESCLKHGYILGLQVHKIINVE